MISRRQFIAMLLAAAAAHTAPLPRLTRQARAQDEELECVIIGGGISGLTAAYLLKERDILLLEALPDFGGRTVSGTWNGWRYALGTEYLGEPEGTLAEIIDDLDLDLVEIPSPMDQIWRGGRFYSGDVGRVELLIREGGVEAFNRFMDALMDLAGDYEEAPDFEPGGELSRLDAMSCRQWFDELELPPIYTRVYNVTFRGLFGANIDEVSALGAFSEIAFDYEGMDHPIDEEDLADLLEEAAEPGDDEGSGAYSFRYGIVEVVQALARNLGHRVRHSSRVTNVAGNDDDGYVVSYEHGGQLKTVTAQSVIFATPMPVTLEIGKYVLSMEQQQLMGQVPYAQLANAAVFSHVPIFTSAFDLALPDGWSVTDVYDCTWMQRKLGEQHEGHVASLYMAPHSYTDRALIRKTDEELLEIACRDLQNIWPDIRLRITGHHIHRFEHAYPVMIPGAFARLSRLWATFEGGVQLAGDGMIYPTFEAATEAATLVAERIEEWL